MGNRSYLDAVRPHVSDENGGIAGSAKLRTMIVQNYITFASASMIERLRLGFYYCQRLITNLKVRRFSHRILLFFLLRCFPHCTLAGPKPRAELKDFKSRGYIELAPILSDVQCQEIHSYLLTRPILDTKGSGKTFSLDDVPENCTIGDYPLSTVVNCPNVMELANHPDILTLACEYLGFMPVITGMSLRWTFPHSNTPDKVQRFHRDCEMGSIKLMVYLTDVDAECGPHTFATGTHLDRMSVRLHPLSDNQVGGEHKAILGSAGTTFFIDTRGLHKGSIPTANPRLMLGVQYSLLPCPLFKYEPVPYTGSSKLQKYVNRLMIA